MMHCHKVRKLLADYMEESTTIAVDQQVRLHLESCRECADLAEGLGRTVSLLRGMPRLETSPDFMPNLRRHLPVAVALSRRAPAPAGVLSRVSQWVSGSPTRRMGLLAAPAAVALAASLYLFGGGTSQPVALDDPVISESAYLAAVAQEHAGYASEHPLIDTSAVNLAVSISNTRELPAGGRE